ncbi:MAG: S1 RNA-binding domain-containing protein [Candidatus Andersenbacteria bacterium]
MSETSTKKEDLMGKLLEQHEDLVHVPERGEILTGTILEKTSNAMYVDLGQLGVGVIYGRELFDDLDTFETAKIGDTVQASVQQVDNEDGYVELSLRSATRERSWEELKHKLTQEVALETEIMDANKGGLMVRISGVTGFLPVSQLAPDHYPRVEGGDKNKILEKLKSYVGQKFTVKIINLDQEEEKLIVSEKSAVSDEISTTLAQLGEGKVVEGTVSGIVDFGAFVKFEESGQELEGLVHISELAWQRIDNPSDFVQIGEKVKAKVIGVDDGLRISLSIKQLEEDPWSKVGERFKIGDKVEGEVLKVTPFGGFIKLDEQIHGLVHISELPDEAQKDPSTLLQAGERKKFTVISLEPKEHRLGLSLRTTPRKDIKKDKKKEEKEADKE